MLSSTLIILNHLVNQKRILQQNPSSYKKEKMFIKSTLSIDLYFIRFSSPLFIFDLLQYVVDENTKITNTWVVSRNIAIFLSIIDICCIFFVLILFNKLFRNQVKSMLFCCKNKIVPLV